MFLPAIATSPSASFRPQRQKRFRSCLPGVVCLWFLVLLTGCAGRPTYPPELRLADSLADHYLPDSARVVLQQCSSRIAEMPEAVRMYHCLLEVKAADKAYITHTSDSLIRDIVAYYEGRGDKRLLPEAYYYAGRVYRDLGDAPEALKYFQLAAERLEGSTDYGLKGVVYSQMGGTLLFQDAYEEALEVYKKAYQCNLWEKNQGRAINTLCCIGDAFTGKGNADSALHYYKMAYAQARLQGNPRTVHRVANDLTGLYQQMQRYDSAETFIQQLLPPNQTNEVPYYSLRAHQYYFTGRSDSAAYYYKKLLGLPNVYGQRIAHQRLAELAAQRGDVQAALSHIRQYWACENEILKTTDAEGTRKMQALYNYNLREQENHRLKMDNARQRLWISYATGGLLSLCVLLLALWQYAQRKRLRLSVQLENMKRLEKELYEQSQAYRDENERRVSELEQALEDKQADNDELHRALMRAEQARLISTNRQIEAIQQEQELSEQAFMRSDIYRKFHEAAHDAHIRLTEEDWAHLQEEIDTYYKDFLASLYECIHSLSQTDLRVCLLLKAHIHITGIARLLNREASTIGAIRRKLYEKVTGKKGKAEDWDKLIQMLPYKGNL